MYDIGIINGNVYLEGCFKKTNVYLEGEKIGQISDQDYPSKRIIDASGKWVLPGLIDPHTHFYLGVNGVYCRDDFAQGSKLALYGGVTTIIDFLDPVKTMQEQEEAYLRRREESKNCVIDYSFHTTIADFDENLEELADWTIEKGMPSIKLFTTYSSTNRRTYPKTIRRLLEISSRKPFTVEIHAEKEELIDESKGGDIRDHGRRRPPESEIEEVMELAKMTEEEKGSCYIVHTNCGRTVKKLYETYPDLMKTKANGRKAFYLESCPHYFAFDESAYEGPSGYKYVMTPPLRPESERQLLENQIELIDSLGTDHDPYPTSLKKKSTLDQVPNGIEGIPYTLSFFAGRYGEKMLPKMTHESAKIHGLYPRKGVLRMGSDGDIVIYDPTIRWTMDGSQEWYDLIQDEPQTSPYYGMTFQGKVDMTILRGHIVMESGRISPIQGQMVKRNIGRDNE